MPADESSPIPAALAHLTHADPLQDSEPPHLLAYLASVPDPRATRGRRHPLVAILGLAAAAVLAGARSVTAIAEWATDPDRLRRFGNEARAAAAHSSTAENCGRPTPVIIRVVHMAPGPTPTLVASAPQFSRSMMASGVPTLPAMTKAFGSFFFR